MDACLLSPFSYVQLFVTLWTITHQRTVDPLSMGFSSQEYWSGSPCPTPGDLPDPGIKPTFLTSPALAGRFFTTSTTWILEFKNFEYKKNSVLQSHWPYFKYSITTWGLKQHHPIIKGTVQIYN